MAQGELNPNIAGAGNLGIGLLWRLKLEPADGVSGTAGSGGSLRSFERESRGDGRNCADASDSRVNVSTLRLGNVMHVRERLSGHDEESHQK